MVSLLALWLPIVLSAVFVFLASSIIHMALGYHANDWRRVPKEDEVMAALRPFNIPPGDYGIPRCNSMADMKTPEYQAKLKAGPVAFLTVYPSGATGMGTPMLLWFLYSVVISLFSAYITSRTVAAGANYLVVFRVIGATAFMGYSLGLLQFSIWYRRNWGTTLKSVFDGLVYALLTAGTFGWLWPR